MFPRVPKSGGCEPSERWMTHKPSILRRFRTALGVTLASLWGFSGCNDSPPPEPNPPSAASAPDLPKPDDDDFSLPSANGSCPIRFESVRDESGIDFVHRSGDSEDKPFPAANGSGVAAFDYDCDGWCDLYFATGNAIPPGGGPGRPNQLYRNLGDWQFAERTRQTGLGHDGYSAGLATGDFNGDGFVDVYVVCYGPNRLFRNLGDGSFLEVSVDAGVDDSRWGTSAVFADIDADGLLDLYSGNYAQWSPEKSQFCGDRERGIRMFCSPTTVPPEDDVLYRNEGDGTFSDVSGKWGTFGAPGRTQGVLAADLNGDAAVDLYIGNDLNPNALLINNQGRGFHNQAELSGAAYDRSGVAQAGMGVAAADANRDGQFDLFVTNFENEHNAYYTQSESGFFQDTSHIRGLAAAGMPHIGWGTMFADFDLDGWHDAIVINGHTDNNLHELGREGEYDQAPLLWHNRLGQFEPVGACAGEYFRTTHPGRGLAIADLDNDLDWDAICCHQDTTPELLRNESKSGEETANSIWLRLIGREANRDGIGTLIAVHGATPPHVEQVMAGGSYLSSSQMLVVLAGSDLSEGEIDIEITWPGGHGTVARGLRTSRRYVIVESGTDESPRVLPLGTAGCR